MARWSSGKTKMMGFNNLARCCLRPTPRAASGLDTSVLAGSWKFSALIACGWAGEALAEKASWNCLGSLWGSGPGSTMRMRRRIRWRALSAGKPSILGPASDSNQICNSSYPLLRLGNHRFRTKRVPIRKHVLTDQNAVLMSGWQVPFPLLARWEATRQVANRSP